MKKLVFLFILSINLLQAQQVLNTFLNKENLKPATVSLAVYNLSTQQNITNFQTEKLLYQASLQKLISTSAALKILGADFRYKTKVNLKGALTNQTFKGVIEIEASGDPSLNEKFIDFVYTFLKEKNINKLEGYIIVNQQSFCLDAEKSWLIEDVANYYGSPAFGFNFIENTYRLTFAQRDEGKTPKILATYPKMEHLKFDNQLVSKGKRDKAYILGMPFSKERKIVGSIPPGAGTFTIKGAIDNPAQLFKNMLIKKLQKEKIDFVFNDNISSENIFASKEYISQELQKIITITNQNSNNLYAEALLKTIGLEKYGYGSTANGLKAIEALYSSQKLSFYDGSGLSRKNLMSSNFLMMLLKNNENNINFKNSLGVSGISGTMKYFSSEKTKGKLIGKSGSADGVLNYAGYFKNSKNEQIAFVFLVNNYTGSKSSVRREMLKVLESYF